MNVLREFHQQFGALVVEYGGTIGDAVNSARATEAA